MFKLAESKILKTPKIPIGSPIGLQMTGIMDKLKMHKSHKAMNDHISNMKNACSGQIKTAYLNGVKYAAEVIADESSSDESTGKDSKDESEEVISILRRGWPDLKNTSQESEEDKYKGAVEGDAYDPYSDIAASKERAKMTKYSPETTS